MSWKKKDSEEPIISPTETESTSESLKFKTAKGLPGSDIIAEPRNFPEEQEKKINWHHFCGNSKEFFD